MHLIEVLMACSVFAIATGSSLQLWSATAVRAHHQASREELEKQIEKERLQLQTLWRTSLQNANTDADNDACAATATQLLTVATSLASQPELQRKAKLSADGNALRIQWSATSDARIKRDRLVTPAGLGLCGLPQGQADRQNDTTDAHPASDPLLNNSLVEGIGS